MSNVPQVLGIYLYTTSYLCQQNINFVETKRNAARKEKFDEFATLQCHLLLEVNNYLSTTGIS